MEVPAVTPDIWTIGSILEWCTQYLERCGDAHPKNSARWLVCEACHITQVETITQAQRPVSMEERSVLRDWVKRRAQGEPLQLISGKAPFRYLMLNVAEGVLIPRPETEVLVSECLSAMELPKSQARVVAAEEGEVVEEADLPEVNVLDLCCGSGNIAISVATEYPAAQVWALDIDDRALALTSLNVAEHGVEDRVQVLASDGCAALLPNYAGTFDAIISNPPYIPTAVVNTLEREVVDYESRLALDGGEDGLDVLRAVLPDCYELLKPDGIAGFELFEDHLEQARVLAEGCGFTQCRIIKDLTGRDRVLLMNKPHR